MDDMVKMLRTKYSKLKREDGFKRSMDIEEFFEQVTLADVTKFLNDERILNELGFSVNILLCSKH